ncbi:hypothetical protein SSP24_74250 [Streptomyces spinoverrucosus]|uniref:DUF8175 domain-containing protein n=1 Tax=Streptomyces spinoverrucosus TaxID=284043 RepID=A0A4Y3VVS3_9ACTN|nr:hypothetical protein [Streptomyces spinoverrucosus]GEC09770.1 hypothetical protein SSP24_74250 [Streptomyces spinoverrucosus]GHB52238.1 hypothetical protein GCM10010397_22640 [Streptomyces spinoverrucosus]
MSPGDEHEASGGYAGTGHTRTRLPDAEPYGARRTRSSSRSLVTVVGVVVLLIAAIAFANRGGDDSTTTEGNASAPQAAPTAPSGERPVETKSAGIPTGFAHDRQGVESAAANYAVTLVSADILKPARRTEIVKQVFVTDKQAALEGQFKRAYSKEFLSSIGLDANGNAKRGSTYVSRTMPIGTKVTNYSDSAAVVEVWCTGVFGTTGETSTNPVTSDWFTLTLQLRWADGDWKVDSFAQKDGPAPVPGDARASSADEMAKAVEEYGGFTYAR